MNYEVKVILMMNYVLPIELMSRYNKFYWMYILAWLFAYLRFNYYVMLLLSFHDVKYCIHMHELLHGRAGVSCHKSYELLELWSYN